MECADRAIPAEGTIDLDWTVEVIHARSNSVDMARMNGEPCIRDLRLTVRRVLEALAAYPNRDELKREYPELEEEDIRQSLAYAAALIDDKVLPIPNAR